MKIVERIKRFFDNRKKDFNEFWKNRLHQGIFLGILISILILALAAIIIKIILLISK